MMMGTRKIRIKRGMSVWLIPFGVEQSWQGDFFLLTRSFSWVRYAGAKNRKGLKGRIENISHRHRGALGLVREVVFHSTGQKVLQKAAAAAAEAVGREAKKGMGAVGRAIWRVFFARRRRWK
jgi:hypothetical protein